MSHSSAQSNVGSHTIYEDGDQRNPPAAEQKATAYKEGVRGSHKNLDSKDERSIANKLASQGGKPDPSHHHNHEHDPEAELSKQDPTKPVRFSSRYFSLLVSC